MFLTTVDYAITAVMLLIPLGIGIYYAWKDSKRINREDYLLGGRDMNMLPVTLSIFVTFQSAISLTGIPSDVYQYGPMISGFYIGIGLSYVVGAYTMVPLMYPLQLTSIFEYLEMRYKSRAVRLLSTVIGMLQTFFYMVIALLAPGLAVQAAAGIPFWMSVAVVGSIGTLYTAIGGIKSVIWTDAFQTVVVFVGIVLLIVRGVMVVGGVGETWDIAKEGGRTFLGEFSPDPRTRHSWWGMIIGAYFIWLTNIFNQSTVQRMSAMRSIEAAKKSYLLNVPCNVLYGVLLTTLGITLYSYFYVIKCDPYEGGIISNRNQMVLVFMLHILRDLPGLGGLFMATIFSGALSTLSSGINALSANTVEDILAGSLRRISEKTVTILAKVMVFVYGLGIVGVTYLARSLEGPVTQMGVSVFGACGSAVLGMFLMGCTVPWANKYGAFAGGFISIVMNFWIVIGSRLHGRKHRILSSLTAEQCYLLVDDDSVLNSTALSSASTVTSSYATISAPPYNNDPYEYGFFLYDVSYEWYGLIGTLVCIVIGLVVSKLTNGSSKSKTDAKLILPLLRKFWRLDELPTDDEKENNSK